MASELDTVVTGFIASDGPAQSNSPDFWWWIAQSWQPEAECGHVR